MHCSTERTVRPASRSWCTVPAAAWASPAFNPRVAMNKNAAIIGVALFHASPAQLAGIHSALIEGLRNGTLRPIIHQELPLGQASRAHEAVMENGHHGKIVLVP